jgi:hypothetical protein
MCTAFFIFYHMDNNAEKIVPQQYEGGETNTEAVETLPTESDAREFFEVVKNRLMNVNSWHDYAGKGTADFQLTDAQGREVERTVQKGDHFKIDIPGPGSVTGEGYDWVQVEEIAEVHEKEEDSIAVRVRPATNPQNVKPDVAHFFTSEATSNFIVKRQGTQVSAAVRGRNEKPNTEAEAVVDKARNAAVATGATTGFSNIQWKSIVNGLLQRT